MSEPTYDWTELSTGFTLSPDWKPPPPRKRSPLFWLAPMAFVFGGFFEALSERAYSWGVRHQWHKPRPDTAATLGGINRDGPSYWRTSRPGDDGRKP